MPADAPGRYYTAQLDGRDVAAIGSQPEAASPVWNTYIWVDSADDAAARAKDAGGRVLTEPFDVLDAGRMAVLADPSGAVFCVWQAEGHRGAQLVNGPGTWVFSDLNTPDPDGAVAFYAAVFGWEAESVDFDGYAATMWRVPGYGDAIEALDPDLRRRHDEGGVPPGFSDAVGWMMPVTDDEPAHWSITFTVEDPDAIASRAVQLGGSVVVAPHDAGVVRMAVLRDPQGAVFAVSRYQPG